MLSVVVDDQARAELTLDLDELFREGARRMLAVALEAEVEAYIAGHAELVDEDGQRRGVGNGRGPPGGGPPAPGGRPTGRSCFRSAGAVPQRAAAPLVPA